VKTLTRSRIKSFLRALWSFSKPLLTAVSIVAIIDALPLLSAGVNLNSLLKGLISVPVGVAIALGLAERQRVLSALYLIITMGALMMALTAAGFDQTDSAFSTAIISIFFLAAWITTPNLQPLLLRVRAPRTADVEELFSRTAIAATAWWRLVRNVAFKRLITLGVAIGGVALLVFAAVALLGLIDRAIVLRILEVALNAVVGGFAMWLVGKRFAGPLAGAGAAILWTFGGVALADTVVAPALVPTALAPVITALALELRDGGTPPGAWLGAVLALALVPIGAQWPLLALGTCLIIVFTFWSLGDALAARGGLIPFLATGAYLALVAPARTIRDLGMQAVASSPGHTAAACASGCDGALPWEFFYPSAFGAIYEPLLRGLLTGTLHWGNFQLNAISPGWAALGLAAVGAISLHRSGRSRELTVWIAAIALGIVLALPSRYLGVVLPSVSRLDVAVAPSFESGAQMALISAFFAALLGGIGVTTLARLPRRAPWIALAAVLAILDVLAIPRQGHLAFELARLSKFIPPASESPIRIAIYPLVTQGFGPEYNDLVRLAHDRNDVLVNESAQEGESIANLSDPNTGRLLRELGAQYLIVSLSDYSRRREMLREAHILLPLDQEEGTSAWVAPEPVDILRFQLVSARADGTVLLRFK
jgi:hypothetical protein